MRFYFFYTIIRFHKYEPLLIRENQKLLFLNCYFLYSISAHLLVDFKPIDIADKLLQECQCNCIYTFLSKLLTLTTWLFILLYITVNYYIKLFTHIYFVIISIFQHLFNKRRQKYLHYRFQHYLVR